MSRVNWGRFVLGGFIASVIAFLTDGLLHEKVIHGLWEQLMSGLNIVEREHDPSALLYFALFDLGRGFVSLFLYVMMRARYGPGPKTAVWAGVVGWIAFCVTCPAQFIPLGFFSVALWGAANAFQLVTSVLSTLAGAAAYSE
jgi:hypothetical protein